MYNNIESFIFLVDVRPWHLILIPYVNIKFHKLSKLTRLKVFLVFFLYSLAPLQPALRSYNIRTIESDLINSDKFEVTLVRFFGSLN